MQVSWRLEITRIMPPEVPTVFHLANQVDHIQCPCVNILGNCSHANSMGFDSGRIQVVPA